MASGRKDGCLELVMGSLGLLEVIWEQLWIVRGDYSCGRGCWLGYWILRMVSGAISR